METTKDQPTEATQASESPDPESRSHGRVIALPGLPSLPGIRQLSWLRPQITLPSRERMLLYAGLGAMAAIDLIDWPVAAAIVLAQVVTSSRSESQPDVSPPGETPAGRPRSAASKSPARRPRG
jgi:hypothetical protein